MDAIRIVHDACWLAPSTERCSRPAGPWRDRPRVCSTTPGHEAKITTITPCNRVTQCPRMPSRRRSRPARSSRLAPRADALDIRQGAAHDRRSISRRPFRRSRCRVLRALQEGRGSACPQPQRAGHGACTIGGRRAPRSALRGCPHGPPPPGMGRGTRTSLRQRPRLGGTSRRRRAHWPLHDGRRVGARSVGRVRSDARPTVYWCRYGVTSGRGALLSGRAASSHRLSGTPCAGGSRRCWG